MNGPKSRIKSFMLKKFYEKKQALKSEKNMNHKKYDWKYETVVQYEIFKNSEQKIQCNKFVDCFDHSEFYIASQKS